MSRRYGRFVDMRTIHRRMNEQDARRQLQAGTLFPAFLKPEVVPFVDVEIVRVPAPEQTAVVDVVLTPKTEEPS